MKLKRPFFTFAVLLIAAFFGARFVLQARNRALGDALVERVKTLQTSDARAPVGDVIEGDSASCVVALLPRVESAKEPPACAPIRESAEAGDVPECHAEVSDRSALARELAACGRAREGKPLRPSMPGGPELGAVTTTAWVLGLESAFLARQGAAAEALPACRDFLALMRDQLANPHGSALALAALKTVLPGCAQAIDVAPADAKRVFAAEVQAIVAGTPPISRALEVATAEHEVALYGTLLSKTQLDALPELERQLAGLAPEVLKLKPWTSLQVALSWKAAVDGYERARAVAQRPPNERAVALEAIDREVSELPHPLAPLSAGGLRTALERTEEAKVLLALLGHAAELDGPGKRLPPPELLADADGDATTLRPRLPSLAEVSVALTRDVTPDAGSP